MRMIMAAFTTTLLLGCAGDDASSSTDATDTTGDGYGPNEDVVIVTTLGEFTIDLLDDEAPQTAANFRQYAQDGFYDGADGDRKTLVHNVTVPLFCEMGRHSTNLAVKPTRDAIANESSSTPSNKRATVSAMKVQGSNDVAAGFIVNASDNSYLDDKGNADGNPVFGRIVNGMDVIDAIMATSLTEKSGIENIPETDVVIESVTVRN